MAPQLGSDVGFNINVAIERRLKEIVGTTSLGDARKLATPMQIWEAHRDVYESIGCEDWARAIYELYVKPLGIPYR